MAFSNAGVVIARRLIAGTIDVPGIGVTGFHVDSSGNLGIGGSVATSGNFTVTSAGIVTSASLTNVGTLATNTLTWGSASSLTAYDAVDLPVRPANPQPSNRQANNFVLSPITNQTSGIWSLSPVAGNLLVACFAWTGTNASTLTVSVAPAGWTTWTGMPVTQGTNVRMHCYYKVATGGDAGPAVTLSGVPTVDFRCMIAEYQNMLGAAPAEAVSSTNSGSSTSPDTGATGATVQAIDLDVAFMFHLASGSPGFTAPTNGFTIRNQSTVGETFGLLDKVTSAVGAQQAGATRTNSANWVAAIQPFQAAVTPVPATGHAQFVGLTHGTTVSLGVVAPNGTIVDLMPNYFSRTADVTIANTETVVASVSIPANFFLAGTSFQILAAGVWTFAAGSSTFRVRIGTTTLTGNIAATTSPVNAANGRLMFIGQITVRTVGAGGTAIANIAGMSAVGWATVVFGSGGPSVAVDTTVANLIEFTFISGAAGANMVFQTATWNLQKW